MWDSVLNRKDMKRIIVVEKWLLSLMSHLYFNIFFDRRSVGNNIEVNSLRIYLELTPQEMALSLNLCNLFVTLVIFGYHCFVVFLCKDALLNGLKSFDISIKRTVARSHRNARRASRARRTRQVNTPRVRRAFVENFSEAPRAQNNLSKLLTAPSTLHRP